MASILCCIRWKGFSFGYKSSSLVVSLIFTFFVLPASRPASQPSRYIFRFLSLFLRFVSSNTFSLSLKSFFFANFVLASVSSLSPSLSHFDTPAFPKRFAADFSWTEGFQAFFFFFFASLTLTTPLLDPRSTEKSFLFLSFEVTLFEFFCIAGDRVLSSLSLDFVSSVESTLLLLGSPFIGISLSSLSQSIKDGFVVTHGSLLLVNSFLSSFGIFG
mmetsp:Transcript_10523/g.15344  ORF Transcript_10523/g.15344 Transcript_10523/m.15344 type:complete len:216 (-) Transcript_10523:2694-3341(-)